MIGFAIIGLLLFLIATGFLSRTSETELMNGFFGIVFGGVGAFGAYLGRKGMGKAIGLGLLFGILGNVLLGAFFTTLWRYL